MHNTVIDTTFRFAMERLIKAGRLRVHDAMVSPHLQLAAIMKQEDGTEALLFPAVEDYAVPVIGNLLGSRENCEAAFAATAHGLRDLIDRGLGGAMPPRMVTTVPVQEVVHRNGIDVLSAMPVLTHAPDDGGRFITAGVVIARDPDTGVYNSSYHRLQVFGPDRLGIKLDWGRHLRAAFERAQRQNRPLPVAVAIGADLALHLAAATMGSQLPEGTDEMAVAGGISGRPLEVAPALTQDVIVPAEAEFVLEGELLPDETETEGPFGEFIGFAAPAAPAPVMRITAITHRRKPIYHAINGYGRETVVLRKYVLEASLLKVLRPAVPIVTDVEMTAGGLHRFHAILQLRKQSDAHDGLQRNAILAAFGALKDLDLIIAVDDDIDIRDPVDVEYALATRMEASRDLFTVPGARGHEYVRVSDNGIRTKLGIDATVPFRDRARFARVRFAEVDADAAVWSTDPAVARRILLD